MRHALVIARRELAEKRFVALAALAFAVLPFLLAAIPGIRGANGAADVIATSAGLLSLGFTAGLALVLGGSIIGRDLAENRLSFYFSRPVSAASIWFGKVTAAVALIVAAFAIIIVPSLLGAGRAWRTSWQNVPQLVLIVLGGSIALFFLAHVIGSFVRSRSGWLAIDFVALCIAAYAGFLILRPTAESGAVKATNALIIIIGIGFIVALVGGGAWQLERGRTDRKRSHVALSQFLWAVIGVTLVLAGAFVAWIVSAKPGDLKSISNAEMPRSGSWAIVGGNARQRFDYRAAFVYNVDTGAYNRLAPARLWRADFTPNGTALLVGRADLRHGSAEIFRRSPDDSTEVTTRLTMPLGSEYVTTASGDRIALVWGNMLSVYDVPHQQSLGSVRLPCMPRDVVAFYFASPTVVRVVARSLRLFEFDLTRRALQQTGELPIAGPWLGVSANADGSRLLVKHDKGVYVIDARTAAVLMDLPMARFQSVTLLHDGGIATARAGIVEVMDAHGNVTHSVAVPSNKPGPLRELSDGRLLFLTRDTSGNGIASLILDPAAGAIADRVPGSMLGQPSYAWPGERDPRRAPIDPPRIYRNMHGQLIRWNYATKTAEVLLPKG